MTSAIVHALAPAPVGGLETVVASLSKGQSREGSCVTVVAWLDPGAVLGPPLDRLAGAGVEVLPVASGRRYWRDVGALRSVLTERPDAVLHTHGYRADVLGGIAARLARRPRVATVHGRTGGGWKNRSYEAAQLLSFRFADVVVAVSDRLRSDLTKQGLDADDVVTVRNAWEPPGPTASRGEARRSLGVDESATLIGWIGRLSREKGPDLLIDVAKRLERDDVRFAAIGGGPLEVVLRRRTEASGLGNRVRWYGIVPEAYRLFPAFDAVLLTSRTEGLPVVVLEAMASGVPVVAPRVGGIPEVLGDREAYLVEAPEPGALADALRRLFGEPEASREKAARARKRWEEDFGVEAWVRRYGAVYERARRSRG